MNRSSRILVLLLLLLVTAACRLSLGTRPQPAPVQATVSVPEDTQAVEMARQLTLPPTETYAPVLTDTSTPAATPTATALPSATPVPTNARPVDASINGTNVVLREGPGLLFPKVSTLSNGARIQITGQSRGGDWLLATTQWGEGWVAVEWTNAAGSGLLPGVPVREPAGVLIIHGRVTGQKGEPVPGLQFAAFQGREENKNLPEARGWTNASGDFYLYLPAGSEGTWRVLYKGVDCKSPAADKRCYLAGALLPRLTDVSVPLNGVLEIQYQPRPQ